LPEELPRLVMVLSGPREPAHWEGADTSSLDFYDVKGALQELLSALGLHELRFEMHEHPSFHPAKCAKVMVGERQLAVFGELHPQVQAQYDLGKNAVQVATLNMLVLLDLVPERFDSEPVPAYPPVLEDLAIVVNESVPAAKAQELIVQTGGKLLIGVALFDIYQGDQVGSGKKSLAYRLTYQHPERTLTDAEVAKLRERIVKRLEQELGAQLRG
jgi:phenylalanyl-tRNA synthetase beta chain